ncbi:MAG: plasma-membrane proton-efflux P-type ATPase [Candidatus Omnitrophica bacterium]|nr:plasma-membrane proton-efflux P-type ATPase [Candidatus Omnitrophota bacterium]
MDPGELAEELGTGKEGLSSQEASRRLKEAGPNALPEKKVNPVMKFLSYFWGPIPWMIEIAAVLSAVVKHWDDFVIISVLLVFNAVVGFWQEHQASSAIDALKSQLALKARVRRDGKWRQIDACELVPGDIVRLRLGDVIPADVKLTEGDYLTVDQSAMTGESLPVNKKEGDIAYSGSVTKQGEMVALVVATGADTFFGKTARLVSGPKGASHFQKAVLSIGDYLICLSVGLVIVLVGVQLWRGADLLKITQFALILTVASIPVAMPAVLSITMAMGAVALSKMKAIVSRLESIEEMAGMDVLCSDKTGTLTQNKLKLGDPVGAGGTEAQEIILAGALASKEEDGDPIDLAVIGALGNREEITKYEQTGFSPFDPVSKRTEAQIKAPGGRTFAVTKGAPQVILALCAPEDRLKQEVLSSVEGFAAKGFRTLGVARSDEGAGWKFLGILPLFDPPREDSADTVKRAGEHGIKVKMVTGDNVAIAREISSRLGMGADIRSAEEFFPQGEGPESGYAKTGEEIVRADGFAQVFPEHKYRIVKAMQAAGHITGMTGDGVNDAPALKQADMGIAVSGATDAARAAADLVLTAPGLSVIVKAIEEARKIFERMNSYAIYRITETIRIMLFMVLAMLAFNMYPITAVMIILLALLNDLPIMSIAKDNTWLDPRPVKWKMKRVLTVSTVLGALGLVETFALLYIVKEVMGLPHGMLQSVIFLKLCVAGQLTLLVARTKNPFWSKPHPAPVLAGALLCTQAIAACIVGFGFFVTALPFKYILGVWAYALVWVFIEDWAKIQVYKHLSLKGRRHTEFLKVLGASLKHHSASHHLSGQVAEDTA